MCFTYIRFDISALSFVLKREKGITVKDLYLYTQQHYKYVVLQSPIHLLD